MINEAIQVPDRRRPPLRKWSAVRWYSLAPAISLVLFGVAMGAFLYLLNRSDIEQQRQTLFRDAEWAETHLRLRWSDNITRINALADEWAADATGDTSGRRGSARQFLLDNPDALYLGSQDVTRRVRWVLHAGSAGEPAYRKPGERVEDGASAWAFGEAQFTRQPTYSPPFTSPDGSVLVEMQVPVFTDRAFVGTVFVGYSLARLLTAALPLNMHERYSMSLHDGGGNMLSSTSARHHLHAENLTYSLPLDPPGHGITLTVRAFESRPALIERLLGAAVIALSLAVAGSSLMLWRYARQRALAEEARDRSLALASAEAAFRRAMEDSMITGMRALDMNGRITYVNRAFCEMVGMTEQALLGAAPPFPYWPDNEIDEQLQQLREILAGKSTKTGMEVHFKRADGTLFPARMYSSPLIDASGRQTGWMTSMTDISERRRIEDMQRQQELRLQQTARLVTMGEMASSLAHELNQPLAAISNYALGGTARLRAKLAQGEQPDSGEMLTMLEKTSEQARRAGQVLRRIRDFVKRNEPSREPCTAAAIVANAVELAQIDANRQRIRIDTQVDDALPELFCDPILIEQVLLNLIKNGAEAMTGNGARQLRVEVRRADAKQAVEFCVADSGPGLSETVRKQIFEPFFTTKSDGMGMGLKICRSIIEYHRGSLWVEPSELGGCAFRFTIPLALSPLATSRIESDPSSTNDAVLTR